MAAQLETDCRPRLFQASPGSPVFRGIRNADRDIECTNCDGVVLLESVGDDAIFDIDIVCASCGSTLELPAFPAGRGLGGVVRYVHRDHHFVGTFGLEMDEVVVGPRAQRQRASETGTAIKARGEQLLDTGGLEEVIAEARSTFSPVLEALRERRGAVKHPLLRLMRRLQDNVHDLHGGGDVVDVRAVISLQHTTAAFRSWARDPSAARIMQESTQAETFAHNTALLQVASMLETARLAPELVPPSKGRTADLILRISASRFVDLDIKAPQALRYPEGQSIKLVEPRRTIRRALRSSRGQFARDAILVIAGEIWFGGIDVYAQAAEHLLSEELPSDASAEARAHYAQLLGIIFASTGYEDLGRSFRPRLFMRWVPNPRYAGEIALELPSDLDGGYSISFWPGPRETRSPDAAARSPGFDTRHDRLRSRLLPTNEVEVMGTIVNQARTSTSRRTVVCQLPDEQRPSSDIDFDVACEAGFTTITVHRDGSLVADPNVGWIDLRGVSFMIA
jgi:hypothetical protein